MEKTRIHILMSSQLKDRISKLIPKGLRSSFSSAAIEMAADAVEEHGQGFLGLMLARQVIFRPNPKQEGGQILTKPVDEKRAAST